MGFSGTIITQHAQPCMFLQPVSYIKTMQDMER